MAASLTTGSEGPDTVSDSPLPESSMWSWSSKHLHGSSINCNPLPSVQHPIRCLFLHVHLFSSLFLSSLLHVSIQVCLLCWASVVFFFQASPSQQGGRTLASLPDPEFFVWMLNSAPLITLLFIWILCSLSWSVTLKTSYRSPPVGWLGHVCGFSQFLWSVISFFSHQC